MFAITVFTGAMVTIGAVLGICEIIRDLAMDRESCFDWFWNYPVRGVFSVPNEMVFWRELEEDEFWTATSEEGTFTFVQGWQDDIAVKMGVAKLFSDEGLPPIAIDIRSQIHEDLKAEYKLMRMGKLNNITHALIN